MKDFMKRNQIILLNSIFVMLYAYGIYANYNQSGLISWRYFSDKAKNGDVENGIMVGILALCLLSTLYQFLERTIFTETPRRFYLLQVFLKIASCFYGFFCFVIGTIFIKGLVENIVHKFVVEPYNFLFLFLVIIFFYLSFLIFKQIFFWQKKALVTTNILDEEIG
jgi:hypothetical protein